MRQAEIFVVEGVLKDRQGCYPTGSWLPILSGAQHSPFTEDGCLIYVKSNPLRVSSN